MILWRDGGHHAGMCQMLYKCVFDLLIPQINTTTLVWPGRRLFNHHCPPHLPITAQNKHGIQGGGEEGVRGVTEG